MSERRMVNIGRFEVLYVDASRVVAVQHQSTSMGGSPPTAVHFDYGGKVETHLSVDEVLRALGLWGSPTAT